MEGRHAQRGGRGGAEGGGASAVAAASTAPTVVVLFLREEGHPYLYCGRLHLDVPPQRGCREPLKFVFRLAAAPLLLERSAEYKELLKLAGAL